MTLPGASEIEIAPLDRTEIVLESYAWRFAAERRDEIATYFAGLRRERAGVWNGRTVLVSRYALDGAVLRGACFETDYASFCAWRAWQFPDRLVHNIFAAAALRSADGAYLVGEMAPATANAGMLYFPCGTPEPSDVDQNQMLDLAGNLGRELLEETGIDIAALAAEPGWTMVRDGCHIALLKRIIAAENADVLAGRITRYIGLERHPELSGVRVVRSPADFDPAMPRFVTAYLKHAWT